MEKFYRCKDVMGIVLHKSGQAAVAAIQDLKPIVIVHCGECDYYRNGMCHNPNTYDDEKTCGNTSEDWFCADGTPRVVK